MDELIEAMATALDTELSNHAYVQRDRKTKHVNLVDGDVDTPAIAKDMLNALHERGWHFSRGTQCP